MRIAIDYDGTYTRDPALWDRFIVMALNAGHEVLCVTQRYPEKSVNMTSCEVIYTSRKGKARHMVHRIPDVWIDDMPHRIFA